jgi:hypothetical protein
MPWILPKSWADGDESVQQEISSAKIEPTSPSSKLDGSPTVSEKFVEQHDISAAVEDLPKFQKSHQWDPNLPQDKLDALHHASQTGDIEAIVEIEATFAEDSPYEQVRAAVRPTDGEEIANTVRAWILGMIFVTIGSGLNMFLSMRLA